LKKFRFFSLVLIFTVSSQAFIAAQNDYSDQIVDKPFFEKLKHYSYVSKDGRNSMNMDSFDPAFLEEWLTWLMGEAKVPGASLCFLKDGELYWKKHLGYANIEQNIPVNDSTVFLTCSISKTIVVTAVMQLYEQGLFKLDDDINEYLPFTVRNPNYPDSAITFRQLMTHLSSINDELGILEGLTTYGNDCPIPLGDFLSGYLVQDGAYYSTGNFSDFPPLGEYDYSNVGASLLAYLVETISNMDFEEYCQEHIFSPLGMEQTSFRLANLDQDLIAIPYLQEDGNLVPEPHPGFPVYPAANLRTSAVHLSRILSMYMQHGTFGKVRILNDSTIDLITTLQYPEILVEEPMGLIWFYKYNYFKHGGYFPGAQAEYGFTKARKSGMICVGNSSNQDWSWFTEFWLLSYARYYQPLSLEAITIFDSDEDNVLEPGEKVGLVLQIKNDINIISQATGIDLTLSSDDPNITLESSRSYLGDLQYLEKKENLDLPFIINIGSEPSPYTASFTLTIQWDNGQEYETNFELEIGQADILLVNDGTSFGGMFLQPAWWYLWTLDFLEQKIHYYDMSLFGDPSYEFISNFPIIIWLTGYDNENTLTDQNQQVLSTYLDNGGKLFLSGQNISDDINGSAFLSDYLHVKHINDTYTGQDSLMGVTGDPIGNDMMLMLNQDQDAMYQFSMSEIEPTDGAEEDFTFASTGTAAAVRFENSIYKTVFFGFGYEGINDFDDRVEVMKRILNYFDENVDIKEAGSNSNRYDLRLIPNPVSSIAIFSYHLGDPGNVELTVYDMNGAQIQTVASENQVAGNHTILFNTEKLPAGLYFYTFTAGGWLQTGKMAVIP
jgi:CubicO group peptidase (beta-lactamase class C family)